MSRRRDSLKGMDLASTISKWRLGRYNKEGSWWWKITLSWRSYGMKSMITIISHNIRVLEPQVCEKEGGGEVLPVSFGPQCKNSTLSHSCPSVKFILWSRTRSGNNRLLDEGKRKLSLPLFWLEEQRKAQSRKPKFDHYGKYKHEKSHHRK